MAISDDRPQPGRWGGALAAALLLAIGSAAGLPACGGDDDDSSRSDPRATLDTALAAFEAGDVDELCDALSERARKVIGYAAHGRPTSCARDVRRFAKWLKPTGDGAPRVTRVDRDGATAVVAVRLGDGSDIALPAVADGGGWRLAGLFDATLSRIQLRGLPGEQALQATPPAPAPRAPRGDVAVRRGVPTTKAPRCPRIGTARFPELTGGCEIELDGERLGLSVATAFGELRFARCGVSYDLRVDGSGEAWVEDFTIDGTNPCFDVMACLDKQRRKIPWRARIDPATGGATLEIEDACLDTCVGRVEGPLRFELHRAGAGWRVRADQAMVGGTGWRFDGPLNATGGRGLTVEGG